MRGERSECRAQIETADDAEIVPGERLSCGARGGFPVTVKEKTVVHRILQH
jgi:hypothetical protein